MTHQDYIKDREARDPAFKRLRAEGKARERQIQILWLYWLRDAISHFNEADRAS